MLLCWWEIWIYTWNLNPQYMILYNVRNIHNWMTYVSVVLWITQDRCYDSLVKQFMSTLSAWVSVLYKLNHNAKSLILTCLCLLKWIYSRLISKTQHSMSNKHTISLNRHTSWIKRKHQNLFAEYQNPATTSVSLHLPNSFTSKINYTHVRGCKFVLNHH